MKVAVFTPRSVCVGVAAGVLVASWVGGVRGADEGWAVLNGLAGGIAALAVYTCLGDGRFTFLEQHRRFGVRLLGAAVIVPPVLFVDYVIGREPSGADDGSLSLLFLFTGVAAYVLGGIMATLDHLEGEDGAPPDPRLNRLTPPRG